MRIAVTGTHGSGKTTLIEDFCTDCPSYELVPEPYWLMAQADMPFANGPTTADLEQQLGQSAGLILASSGPDVIFDRCPLDFLAYLDVVSAKEGFEWSPSGKLLAQIERAMAAIDLVVFVPLTRPDEIDVTIEYPKLRARVDARLKAMLREEYDELLEAGPRVVEVTGSRAERAQKLLQAVVA
jgi:GTPase SAR1 family protein